ncbi:uncharacterized protein LOC135839222 [Planococcus citri]|uniref:uncharacterized protein LOC135839222 n=1 Tax=Planococcus citri TaxID=170843 RepID=UPI0031FA00B1
MKSLSVVLVFIISLACARAAPGYSPSKETFQKCKAAYTFKQDPDYKIWTSIYGGVGVQLTYEEKCFLHCILQKDNYFDDNGNLRHGSKYIKDLLNSYPDIAKYVDVLMSQIFQIARSVKSFNDKCERAFTIYHQIHLTIITLRMARSIENVTHIKDRTFNTVESGNSVGRETSKQLRQYFGFFDGLINNEATWETMKGDTSTTPFCKVAKSMKIMQPGAFAISHKPETIECPP